MNSKVFDIIEKEKERQGKNVELIASENFVSENIMKAVGSCLTNKYSEGYPGKRYYGGCEYVDELESYCQEKWKEVFHTDYHVNVQPHSGSQANMAAFMALLEPKSSYRSTISTILAMNLNDGGHLTHGSKVNFSGKFYDVYFYNVDKDGFINYNDLEEKIKKYKPGVVLAGASAYSREIDFRKIREIINRCSYNYTEKEESPHNGDIYEITHSYKPYFMVDMAHIAGLVATGYHQSPFGLADIITTTTHKTLRGPRGGLIFCKPELAKKVDSAVFPGTQGGPLQHVIAGKAICAEEALRPEYKEYIKNVVENSKAMANRFTELGYEVVTGGTDNHLFLIDFSKTHPNLTGKFVQDLLDKHSITLNKNCVPNEKRSPQETSGVRIGTAAMTTRGYTKEDFIRVVDTIDTIIKDNS